MTEQQNIKDLEEFPEFVKKSIESINASLCSLDIGSTKIKLNRLLTQASQLANSTSLVKTNSNHSTKDHDFNSITIGDSVEYIGSYKHSSSLIPGRIYTIAGVPKEDSAVVILNGAIECLAMKLSKKDA